ncbi:MAG: hypothetical protein WC769_03860 [Thermodesulfovibrionales bacterium]|jgi:hypothetical protein
MRILVSFEVPEKSMGIAIFLGTELRDRRIKSLEGKWSKEKMKKTIEIISSLIER